MFTHTHKDVHFQFDSIKFHNENTNCHHTSQKCQRWKPFPKAHIMIMHTWLLHARQTLLQYYPTDVISHEQFHVPSPFFQIKSQHSKDGIRAHESSSSASIKSKYFWRTVQFQQKSVCCHVKHTILKTGTAQQYSDTTNQLKLLIL
jgi:hypothetical protein